jgi:hypothetical protein
MPYSLSLPAPLPNDGWKVKIYDGEPDYEPPHVTIRRGLDSWRINLRNGEFLDDDPRPSKVANEVIEEIDANWETLADEWNARYPNNPV